MSEYLKHFYTELLDQSIKSHKYYQKSIRELEEDNLIGYDVYDIAVKSNRLALERIEWCLSKLKEE
ncbi:hypothetical protein J2T56_003189 [Natronobacillus azotifigens]|uniref:Uncharacterized protein n=1 Tax=Natronobacillus azotifigens TaxID=472978 RepID=A0A9J6RH06_9BACI|nr:hypothetical protein [Natronobacillus azotifigens]MCZ0704611.1 hypothetical protein [Natronobacillus azotifigens]